MLYKKYTKGFLIALLSVLVIVSPIILNSTALLGVDGYFQYSRIYEAAMQIKNLNFSFLNLYSFQQSGRVVNQLYSPLMTYFFGVILLITGTWFKFQVVSLFLLHLIALISMYYAAKKMKFSNEVSLLLGIIFSASSAITGFIFGVTWRSWAFAFLPLLVPIALYFYEGKLTKKTIIYTSLSIAIIAQFQILTLVLVLPFLVPFFVRGYFFSKNKLILLRNVFIAALLTIMLSLNVIVPMIEVFTNNKLVSPVSMNLAHQASLIFQPTYLNANSGADIVMSILAFTGLILIFAGWSRYDTFTKMFGITALVYIVIGTGFVPWNNIASIFPGLSSFLQMPRRITWIGTPFLILSIPLLVTKILGNRESMNRFLYTALAIVSVVLITQKVNSSVDFVQNPKTSIATGLGTIDKNLNSPTIKTIAAFQSKFHTGDLGALINSVDRTTPDYTPVNQKNETNQKTYDEYLKYVSKNWRNFRHTVNHRDATMTLTWVNKSNSSKNMNVPVVAYKNTELLFNGKTVLNNRINRSVIGTIYLSSKPGVNNLVVGYTVSWFYKSALLVSLLTGVSLMIVYLYLTVNKRLFR